MEQKYLGKIKDVQFGYQDYLFGLHFKLCTKNIDIPITIGYNHKDNPTINKDNIENKSNSKPNNDEILIYNINIAKQIKEIKHLLDTARVSNIGKLENIPIETIFEDDKFKDWRILTELL